MPGCFLGIKYGSYKITICRNCAAEGEKNGKPPKRKYAQYKTTNRIFLPGAACRQNASLFFKNRLTFRAAAAIIIKLSAIRQPRGGVAHLGERLNGIQEVRGSIPLISTTTNRSGPCATWPWVRVCCFLAHQCVHNNRGRRRNVTAPSPVSFSVAVCCGSVVALPAFLQGGAASPACKAACKKGPAPQWGRAFVRWL